jgi:hypothetical protein
VNTIQIDVINESSLTDAELQGALPAFQAQIEEDFKPVWGFGADLHFIPKGGTPTKGHWWMGVFDRSDQAGALGYHDMTSDGLPFGKVFYLTDKEYGEDWLVTMSHELLEILADPYINLTAMFQKTNTTGSLVAYETADPTQGDVYSKRGIPVSNFVYPAYFEPGPHAAGTRFDHMGLIHGAFPALRPGGYYSYFDLSGPGWKQKEAEQVPAHKRRPHNGSRRELRNVDHEERRWSTIHKHAA